MKNLFASIAALALLVSPATAHDRVGPDAARAALGEATLSLQAAQDAVSEAAAALGTGSAPTPTPTPAPTPTPNLPPAGTLSEVLVPGPDGLTIAQGIAALKEGGTLRLEAMEFDVQRGNRLPRSINIVGSTGPGGAHTVLTSSVPVPKGAFYTTRAEGTYTIRDLTCRGLHNSDRNATCFRYSSDGGTLAVSNVSVDDGDSCIMATGTPEQQGNRDVSITGGKFTNIRSPGNGLTHCFYMMARTLIVDNVTVENVNKGHMVKCVTNGACIVRNSTLGSMADTSSMTIEVSGGGDLTVENNTLIEGPNSVNHKVISYGVQRPGFNGVVGDIVITGTHLTSHHAGKVRLLTNLTAVTPTFADNTLVGERVELTN